MLLMQLRISVKHRLHWKQSATGSVRCGKGKRLARGRAGARGYGNQGEQEDHYATPISQHAHVPFAQLLKAILSAGSGCAKHAAARGAFPSGMYLSVCIAG
jgi:hypothetical protein